MKKYKCPKCDNITNTSYCFDCDTSIPSNARIEVDEVDLKRKYVCPVCDKENDKPYCSMCGITIVKNIDLHSMKQTQNNTDSSGAFLVIVSFLIPLFGVILGAIYIGTDNDPETGKVCLGVSIVSMVLYTIVYLVVL